MGRIFDHVDLRVPDAEAATKFYEKLLPALGFTKPAKFPGWVSFLAEGDEPTEFFGFTESPSHRPNENRIAFRTDSDAAVDAFLPLLQEIGALNIEGPCLEDADVETYYAIFFEDPFGNRLEICHRTRN